MKGNVCIAFGKGCPRTQVDAGLLHKYFAVNDWQVTNVMRKADLVLVSTCGVETRAERESMRFLSTAIRKKGKSAHLIVFGCLPGVNPDRLREKFNGLAITPETIDQLDQVIDAKVNLKDVKDPNVFEDDINNARKSFSILDRMRAHYDIKKTHEFVTRSLQFLKLGPKPLDMQYENAFHLRIALGCPGECSYCAIRFATGPIKSKPMDQILEEFEKGLNQGYEVFHLIAGDVGGYGQDTDTNIAVLLKALFNYDKQFKLLISEFNPLWLTKYFDELSDLITANADRIGYIMIPIQSGSNRILRLMKRGHTVEDAARCLLELENKAKSLDLATHVMVGFPGETEEDFNATLKFLRTVKFKNIFSYKYSDRPNTLASTMPNKVDEKIKSNRLWRLRREFPEICKI